MSKDRLSLLMSLMSEDVDCALITSDENRRYFSSMRSSAGVVAVFRDGAYLLIDGRYYQKACETVKDMDVILEKSRAEQLCTLMKEKKVRRCAVEARSLTVSEYNMYSAALSVELDGSNALSDAANRLRMVKSASEVRDIVAAQRIAEAALNHVLGLIKPGITEKEIALELDNYMLRNGAEALSFETIALTGANTSMPHGVPSDDKVKNGDFVLMDFGATVNGMHSDMTRTVCVGKPTDEMEDVYNAVLSAQEAAISTVRSGVECSAVDRAARSVLEDAGYGDFFVHSLGHGVGLEIHESPNLSPKSSIVLHRGNVVTAEPGVYIPQKFGVRIEDLLVVCDENCENLTEMPKKMLIL